MVVAGAIRSAVIGATILAGVVTGCSSTESSTSPSGQSPAAAAPVSGAADIVVDGQKQDDPGAVTCTADGDNVVVGIGDATNGIGAVVSAGDAPVVHSVGLGTVDGVALGYSDAAQSDANATALKSGNAYKITGTAIGADPTTYEAVTKTFEIAATCP